MNEHTDMVLAPVDVALLQQVDSLGPDATFIISDASAIVTVTMENANAASEALARCTSFLKRAEELRLAVTTPIRKYKEWWDNVFKQGTAEVAAIEKKLRAGISKQDRKSVV